MGAGTSEAACCCLGHKTAAGWLGVDWAHALPALQTDLNGDGKPEVITATPDGKIRVLAPRRAGDGFAEALVLSGAGRERAACLRDGGRLWLLGGLRCSAAVLLWVGLQAAYVLGSAKRMLRHAQTHLY